MRQVVSGAALALLLFAASLAPPASASLLPKSHELTHRYSYEDYLRHSGKVRPGSDAEYRLREGLFAAELAAVLRHNARPGQLYRQGLNKFSDWTAEEKATHVMAPGRSAFVAGDRDADSAVAPAVVARARAAAAARMAAAAPDRLALDYRRANPPVLTAVKDQGQCGSCWSFSTTETIESHAAIQNGILAVLSMQQMVSCVPVFNMTMVNVPNNFSNPTANLTNLTQAMYGCNGYMPNHALHYVATVQGGYMTQEWEVPYQSYWDQMPPSAPQYKPTPPCMNSAQREFNGVNVTGVVVNPANDVDTIEDVLFRKGPLITVMMIAQGFMSYEGGVYSSAGCNNFDYMAPSHAVQIVGYGHDTDLAVDYWIVRNSWSPYWGENGYFRLLRTEPSECGQMWLPSAEDDAVFVRQKACGTCGILGWTAYPTIGQKPKSPL